MAAFFPDVLDEFLSPAFLEGVREKFHYGETQGAELLAVAEKMLPLMRKEAFWVRRESGAENLDCPEHADVVFERVAMSLGEGVDRLQEYYGNCGMLSQCYMLEVLAGELLMRGYGAYNRYISENTSWHVAGYHFPGSEEAFPLEQLPRLLKDLTSQIICNEAFCMIPGKSVAFLAELTRDETVHCRGICVGCDNANCPNRVPDDSRTMRRMAEMTDIPLTYGYSRIFGMPRHTGRRTGVICPVAHDYDIRNR